MAEDRVMRYKSLPLDLKATEQEKGGYKGHFAVFGNVDLGGDIIHPGAFTKTLQERAGRIKVFMGHDWSKLIGPPPALIKEDAIGLYAEGRLTLGSFWGKEAYALISDGALTEGSIGYYAMKWDYEETEDHSQVICNLREIMLLEISPVPLGMNPLTTVETAKSLAMQGMDWFQGRSVLETLLGKVLLGERLATISTVDRNALADRLKAVVDELQIIDSHKADDQPPAEKQQEGPPAAEPQTHSALMDRFAALEHHVKKITED